MQIDAHKRTLGEVLQLGQHVIPRYQRRYAWEPQNIKDFWNDIIGAADPHFLGSMVTSGLASEPREIIDGQQRLTTTVIALCVLRDHYLELDEKPRVTGIKAFLEFDDRNGNRRTRLSNRDTAASSLLNDNVIVEVSRRSQSPAFAPESLEAQAYKTFEALARGALSGVEDKVFQLDEIRDSILGSEVVYINVDDRKNAFTIFETLNDRGLSLTVMDLVKNLLFSEISESDEDSSERLWSNILETASQINFEKLSPDDFLYYAWNSRSHSGHGGADTIESSRLRRSIADQIKAADDGPSAAREVIASLEFDARILSALDQVLMSGAATGSWKELDRKWRSDKYEDICQRLYGVLVTGANQPIPLLIALMRAYLSPSKVVSRSSLLKFLRVIERFQFRWTIAQKGSTSTVRRLYRSGASSISSATTANDVNAAIIEFEAGAAKIDASDNQFQDGIGRLAYSGARRKDVFKVRHILMRIERSYSSTALDLGRTMSIEHLQGLEGRSERTPRNAWIFKIGNLALLPPEVNSALPQEFSDKCEDLAAWISPDDRDLTEAIEGREWRSELAAKRLASIARQALRIWPKLSS